MRPLFAGLALLVLERVSRPRGNSRAGPRDIERELYGSHWQWRLRGRASDELPTYGISFSDFPKIGVWPHPSAHYPRGTWFYALTEGYPYPELRGRFAEDRAFANLIRLVPETTLYVRSDEEADLWRERFRKTFREGGTNRMLLGHGFKAIVDLSGNLLPIEYPQGVMTWPGGGELVQSIRPPRRGEETERTRFERTMRRLSNFPAGSLSLSGDQIRRLLLHRGDHVSRLEVESEFLRRLDFSEPDALEWLEDAVLQRGPNILSWAMDNPTLPDSYRARLGIGPRSETWGR